MNKDLIIQKQKELIGKYLKTNIHINVNGDYSDYQRLKDELAALESEQEEPEQSSSEELMIEKAIIEMIEANLPIKGFKEWMIEKQFDHNTSYSEFYAENDEGYMMHGINKLYRHWKRTAWKGKEQK